MLRPERNYRRKSNPIGKMKQLAITPVQEGKEDKASADPANAEESSEESDEEE